MAVQAQCSSNVLLLNRTLQEAKTQIGNTLIDHHQSPNHSLFNSFPVENCNTNQRKRGREDIMNQFMFHIHQQQSQCNQLMDISQIQSRNIDVSTGLRLAFNDQQQQHSLSPQSSGYLSLFSEDLSSLINQQRDEIEHYLQSQGEELRRKLAEKRNRHYGALIGAANESASRMMRDKAAEAEKAARSNAELSALAAQLSAESQVWQAKARAQEAVAAALQAQLQQAVVTGERCAEIGGAAGEAEDAESAYVDPERVVVVSGPGCKACGKRVASVVLLPCRHLCVCTECNDVVQACPLCLSFRSSSIEVYMS